MSASTRSAVPKRPINGDAGQSIQSSRSCEITHIQRNLSHRKPTSKVDAQESHSEKASPSDVSTTGGSSKKQSKPSQHTKRSHRASIRRRPDGTFRSKYGDIKFKPRESILDKEVVFGASFYGFYVAFWVGVSFFALQTVVSYHNEDGSIFRSKLFITLVTDLWKIAGTDLWMYVTTWGSVLLHMGIKHGYFQWRPVGIVIQTVSELFFVGFFIWFARWKQYPWIGRIFLMLHSVVLLMKVHSFAFYNGYMWDIKREFQLSKQRLASEKKLDTKAEKELTESVAFCQFELDSQAERIAFPDNISWTNFWSFSMFPVLVYEVSYPLTTHIRWGHLLGTVAGVFGLIFVMVAHAQLYLYPVVMSCLELSTQDFSVKLKYYPLMVIRMVPPFLCMFLMVFFLIWELILNAIAEITYFADHQFYRHWWNSVDWNQYARDWNKPVHDFLLRHIYHASMSAFHVSKSVAALLTFVISSLMHEVAMHVIFNKFRGYLLGLQMSQLPLNALAETEFVRQRPVLANSIFWIGMVLGPSLMCTMYLVF